MKAFFFFKPLLSHSRPSLSPHRLNSSALVRGSSRIKQVSSCSSAFELVAVGGTLLLPAITSPS